MKRFNVYFINPFTSFNKISLFNVGWKRYVRNWCIIITILNIMICFNIKRRENV